MTAGASWNELVRSVDRRRSLLYGVAKADPDLLRPVVLLDRHARLRVDEIGDRAAVQISIADIKRRAGRELESETCRERPGHGVGRRADRTVPVLLRERDIGLRVDQSP